MVTSGEALLVREYLSISSLSLLIMLSGKSRLFILFLILSMSASFKSTSPSSSLISLIFSLSIYSFCSSSSLTFKLSSISFSNLTVSISLDKSKVISLILFIGLVILTYFNTSLYSRGNSDTIISDNLLIFLTSVILPITVLDI